MIIAKTPEQKFGNKDKNYFLGRVCRPLLLLNITRNLNYVTRS